MKLSLSENIRTFRKQRKMTQEKLAEALGVTVGAVYKWESGLSQPELSMLVEMADFFDTSVDVLLGYRLRDNRLEAAARRLTQYAQTLDPEGLNEAEKIIGRYSHMFGAVYGCAQMYLIYGVSNHNEEQIRRAIDLLERSRILLSQNDDPKINDATICGDLSTAWFVLGERERSLDILKKNNAGGLFSDQIGAYLACFMNRSEDAVPYLWDSLMSNTSALITTLISYVFVFRSRGDWDSALSAIHQGISLISGMELEARSNSLSKTHAVFLALLAYVQEHTNNEEEAQSSLRQAAEIAGTFDQKPDYSLKSPRFSVQNEEGLVFDVLGATASESIVTLFTLLGETTLINQWKELNRSELASAKPTEGIDQK